MPPSGGSGGAIAPAGVGPHRGADRDTWAPGRVGVRRAGRRRFLALGVVMVLAGLFYAWTAATGGYPISSSLARSPNAMESAYNQLATAFLHGHLALLTKPPRALLALRHPYQPRYNLPFQARFHDLALYHGHFYLTWGPTPVVTLLIPWKLLGLGAMPVNLGVIVFFWFGLLCSILLLCTLVDRYLPGTPLWKLTVGAVTLALSNVAPFVLRRPLVYELAIASAYCFAMLGAWLLASGTLGRRVRPVRLALASLAVGLAVGGRPSLVFEGLLLVLALVYLLRRSAPAGTGDHTGSRRRPLVLGTALLGPFVVLMGLLLAYNQARFGAPLQVGTRYTLTNWDVATLATTRPSYLAPGLFNYLLYPVRWTYAFPFFTLTQPPMYSAALPQSEITGGLLTTTPIVWIVLPGLVVLRRRHGALSGVLAALVAVAALVLAFVSLAFWSTTMRYEVDFATFLLVPALLVWFALTGAGTGHRRWPRRLLTVVGVVAMAYGCVAGLAMSVYGYYDGLRVSEPGTYWDLARLASPLPTLGTMLAGHPVLARAEVPHLQTLGNGGTADLGTTTFAIGSLRTLELEIYAPSSGRWALAPTFTEAGGRSGPVTLIVRSGPEHEHLVMGTRPRSVVLRLGRGLNRVELAAVADPPSLAPLVVAHGLVLEPGRLPAGHDSPGG
ncbi:MAG TPA: hypothetical protein VMB72_09555 [Acidimicrobiales bacterium]|nr:hypothetical protein [Acidimicrobiales bacterium]